MNGSPDAVGTLIEETRVRRQALHNLVARVRSDHALWQQRLRELPLRPRLTSDQRAEFRRRIAAVPWR